MSVKSLLWYVRMILLNRTMLWLLFISNLIGTLYGYYWYKDQLIDIYQTNPLWQLVFVPDSPTGSLFFTIAVAFLLYPPSSKGVCIFRKIIEGLAVVTSVKYGIWAIAMIVAGAYLGDALVWQHYMLMSSHLIMAVESLIYLPFFAVGLGGLVVALVWTLWNDAMDYLYGIYPYLSFRLDRHITAVRNFTVGLTFVSFIVAWIVRKASWQKQL